MVGGGGSDTFLFDVEYAGDSNIAKGGNGADTFHFEDAVGYVSGGRKTDSFVFRAGGFASIAIDDFNTRREKLDVRDWIEKSDNPNYVLTHAVTTLNGSDNDFGVEGIRVHLSFGYESAFVYLEDVNASEFSFDDNILF